MHLPEPLPGTPSPSSPRMPKAAARLPHLPLQKANGVAAATTGKKVVETKKFK